MGLAKQMKIEQDELEGFVEEYRDTGLAPEATRTMRNHLGRFERIYGAVYRYDDETQVFIPNTGIAYIVEPIAAPAPTKGEDVGYHGLTTDDL